MAAEAPPTPELLGRFGPQRAYQAGRRLDTGLDPDKLVKTHCCFCGQQCGLQLKVKDNQVVGFEPWLDFPFNRGMLCPKGIRRTASEIQRIQSQYGNDAFAVLGGASMTTEKYYLLGKFARVCLKTKHI